LKRFAKIASRLFLLILAIGTNCISPVDFEVENIGGRLVVSGRISTLKGRSFVEVGQTSSKERLPEPVSGASVKVSDDAGNSFYFFEKGPGVYRLDTTGIPGRTYFLTVIYENRTYRSTPEVLKEYVSKDSVSYSFRRQTVTDLEGIISARTFVDLFAHGGSPTRQEPIIRWETEEVYVIIPTSPPGGFAPPPPPCFVTQNADPQRIVMLNRTNLLSDEISGHHIASRVLDQSFHTRHYFNVYHSSITNEAYDYWRKVNVVANQNGSIFSEPPAEVIGNVRNVNDPEEKVMGYFQAANETMYRFYLVHADLPIVLRKYCEFEFWRQANDYPAECANCLRVRNSSLERPDWF
jgi:hypothetical protein